MITKNCINHFHVISDRNEENICRRWNQYIIMTMRAGSFQNRNHRIARISSRLDLTKERKVCLRVVWLLLRSFPPLWGIAFVPRTYESSQFPFCEGDTVWKTRDVLAVMWTRYRPGLRKTTQVASTPLDTIVLIRWSASSSLSATMGTTSGARTSV